MSDFVSTLEGIHERAWADIKPLLNFTGEYITDAVEAWTGFINTHKNATMSKKERMFFKNGKQDISASISDAVASANAKIEEILAAAKANMEAAQAAWTTKHAEYDIQGKIDELRKNAQMTIQSFLGGLQSHKSARMSKSHTPSHNKTAVVDWMSEFQAKADEYKAEFEAKIDELTSSFEAKKADLSSKLSHSARRLNALDLSHNKTAVADWMSEIEAKAAEYKADFEAKIDELTSSFEAKKADLSSKLSHSRRLSTTKGDLDFSAYMDQWTSAWNKKTDFDLQGKIEELRAAWEARVADWEAKHAEIVAKHTKA